MRRPLLLVFLAVLAALAALGQRGRFSDRPFQTITVPVRNGEVHFIRVEYTDIPGARRGYGFSSRDGMGAGWWMMDWPDAEQHFTAGVSRLTRVDAGDPRHFRLTDPRLFDYPWIYATQTAWWDLSDAEVARLREYLLRGGYLVVDDMWGADQWELFRMTMQRVFPDQPIVDIEPSDSVMHMVYDIEEKDRTIIPGSRHLRFGYGEGAQVVYPDGAVPAWRAIFDPKHRMVVAVNFNTDVADAWEFADVPYYPEKMTALAYRYGINYLIYAMTH
jgi:hypothetical protein